MHERMSCHNLRVAVISAQCQRQHSLLEKQAAHILIRKWRGKK